MKYKCLIFDLDGTLLDSLQGILDAVNLSFKQMGFNIHRTYEEGKYFIGSGAIVFAQRAMEGQNIPVEKEREVMERFLVNYQKIQSEETKPFKGIKEMLLAFQKAGYQLAIASNKPQMLLDPIVKQLFPEIHFAAALGQRINTPEKPDPFIIYEIMNKCKLDGKDCLYIGDSEYDYKTAHNAGIDCAICRYGYGFYDKEWAKKSTYLVDSVEQLKNLLI
jgi:phosphoglycolate phosphatase